MTAGHDAPPHSRYVVVGASGILAPLGALLRGPGVVTHGISRGDRLGEGEWDRRIALDATDVCAVVQFSGEVGTGYVLVGYAPALSPDSWMILAGEAVAQTLVVTSDWAAPGARSPRRSWQLSPSCSLLRLGWTGPRDAPRWHRPTEIAEATGRLLRQSPGSQADLGRLRPWTERPQHT